MAPTLIVALYDDAGVTTAISDFAPWLTGRAAFLLVTGNIDKPVDHAWLQRSAARLRKRYPQALIIAGTSGLKHVAQLASHVPPGITAIDYIYEPHQSNEPEFSWSLTASEHNLRAAAALVQRHHLLFFAQPTGMPLVARPGKPHWNYAQLARNTDALIIQAQRYCYRSPSALNKALTTLQSQFQAQHATSLPYVQLTLDPVTPNGVNAATLERCASTALEHGMPPALWFSAAQPQSALGVLETLFRQQSGTR